MTGKLSVVDYEDKVDGKNCYQGYTMKYNCLWVTVTKNERGTGRETEEVAFERSPQNDDWLDAAHVRIGRAIYELEAAILAAVRKEN